MGYDEAASEGNIELARVGFAPELDGCLLKLTVAKFIRAVHEHGGDAINEVTGEIGEAGEVDPTELLNGGKACGELLRIDAAMAVGEGDAVIKRIKTIASWLLILDGEADEVFGRGAGFPVHGEQGHAFATVEFERKECR